MPPVFTSGDCVEEKGLVARTTAPHLRPGTKRQPGEPRTACSLPANAAGTSWQLAPGGPCPEPPGLATLDTAFQGGVGWGGWLRPQGMELHGPMGSDSQTAALGLRPSRTWTRNLPDCLQDAREAQEVLMSAQSRTGHQGRRVQETMARWRPGLWSLRAVHGWACEPVGHCWPRRGDSGSQSCSPPPHPPPPRRGQRAAGAMRAWGWGWARACMLKDPWLPAASPNCQRQNPLPSHRWATAGQVSTRSPEPQCGGGNVDKA